MPHSAAKSVGNALPPLPPVSSHSVRGPPFPAPTLRGRTPSATLPLAAKPRTAGCPCALRGVGSESQCRGRSRRTRSSWRPSALGTWEGAPGVRRGRPSQPASHSPLPTGLRGEVWGGDPAPTPGLPQPVGALGPCRSSKQRPARRRQGGVRATLNSLPALGTADLRGPSSPQLLSPGSAGRGPRAAALCRLARRESWVQTCESPQGHPLINDDVLTLSPAASLPPRNEICLL